MKNSMEYVLLQMPLPISPFFPPALDCLNVLMYHISDTIQQRR